MSQTERSRSLINAYVADELRAKSLMTSVSATERVDLIALLEIAGGHYAWVEKDAEEKQRALNECIASIGPLDETTNRELNLQKRRQQVANAHKHMNTVFVNALISTHTNKQIMNEQLLHSYRQKVRSKQLDTITDEERAENTRYHRERKAVRALASARYRLRRRLNEIATTSMGGNTHALDGGKNHG